MLQNLYFRKNFDLLLSYHVFNDKNTKLPEGYITIEGVKPVAIVTEKD